MKPSNIFALLCCVWIYLRNAHSCQSLKYSQLSSSAWSLMDQWTVKQVCSPKSCGVRLFIQDLSDLKPNDRTEQQKGTITFVSRNVQTFFLYKCKFASNRGQFCRFFSSSTFPPTKTVNLRLLFYFLFFTATFLALF
jgi:hypothetical protein